MTSCWCCGNECMFCDGNPSCKTTTMTSCWCSNCKYGGCDMCCGCPSCIAGARGAYTPDGTEPVPHLITET